MPRATFIRFFAILLAILFLMGQGLASAHAAEYGIDHDHDHDQESATCMISVLGEETFVLPVPLEVQTEPVDETPLITLQPTRVIAFSSIHPTRAPPPRAPPQTASHTC